MGKSLYDLIGTWIRLDKNILLYPSGHSAIDVALKAVMSCINDQLIDNKFLVIFCFKGYVRVNNEVLSMQGRHVSDFATQYSQKGIVSITIRFGISQEEVEGCLRLIQMIPAKHYLVHHPEILTELNQIKNIEIKALDLTNVQFTVGYSSENQGEFYNRDIETSIWEQLLMGDINTQDADVMHQEVVERYRVLLKEQLDNDAQDTSVFFRAVDHLFKEFEPYLKAKIATETVVQLDKTDDEKIVETALSAISDEMIIQMLEQVRYEGREISPALLKILGALYSAQPSIESVEDKAIEQKIDIKQEDVEKLIEREYYEQYVLDDYREMLLGLAQNVATPNAQASNGLNLIRESFKLPYVESHVTESFFNLVINSDNRGVSAETLDLTIRLMETELLKGNYKTLSYISEQLDSTQYSKVEMRMHPNVMRIQQFFKSNNTVQKMSKDFSQIKDEKAERDHEQSQIHEYSQFHMLIVKNYGCHLQWLLENYIQNSRNEEGQMALKILLSQKQLLGEGLILRFSEAKDHEMGKLFNLLRLCEAEMSAMQLHKLLSCKNKTVRIEAIKHLLNEDTSKAIPYIKELLYDENIKTQLRCLEIVNQFRIIALKETLFKLVPKWYIPRKKVQVAKKAFAILSRWEEDIQILNFVDRYLKWRWCLSPKRLRIVQEGVTKQH